MSRRAALLGLAALAGCGFTPVYGTRGTASHLYGQIAFELPDTIAGYHTRQELESKLGVTQTAAYVLTVTLDPVQDIAVAINDDNAARRTNLLGQASFKLADIAGNPLADGEVQASAGYSRTGNTVATSAAEDDALRRLSVNLADQIATLVWASAPAPR